jgi:Flp pilus assembly pilin Flp
MKTKNYILARRFFLDRSGNTAIEYAIIVSLVAIGFISLIHNIGLGLATKLASAAQGLMLGWYLDPFEYKNSPFPLELRRIGRLSWRPLSFQTKRAMSAYDT